MREERGDLGARDEGPEREWGAHQDDPPPQAGSTLQKFE